LTFDDGSIEFVSSICAIEHIGQGRYGDPLDSLGSIKALKEVVRVIKKGGYFLFSAPVSHTPGIELNAHRVFHKQQILELLPQFEVKKETFLFPHHGKEEDLARLNGRQFSVWCALCRQVKLKFIFLSGNLELLLRVDRGRLSQTGGEIQIDIDDDLELLRGGVGHDIKNAFVDQNTQAQDIFFYALGKRILFIH
jgi:SAM-dependent methyltransferase